MLRTGFNLEGVVTILIVLVVIAAVLEILKITAAI
jgi:hypothetical protein